MGPMFGYHTNAIKCWLIIKPNKFEEAMEAFQNTGINITTEGRRHHGAALGSRDFLEDYVYEKVKQWIEEVIKLSEFAKLTTTGLLCRLHIWIKISLDLFHAHVARYPGIITPSRRCINVQFCTIYNRA